MVQGRRDEDYLTIAQKAEAQRAGNLSKATQHMKTWELESKAGGTITAGKQSCDSVRAD